MNQGRVYKVESCVVSLAQALDAQARGADRVELCIRLETEGMTPDLQLTASLCDHLHIPVRVMIRATEEGFEANAHELRQMIDAIESLKQLPIEGFVFGVMKGHHIDHEAMITLLHHAHPLPVTFHKAIDMADDIADELDWLNQFVQIDTLLTSGSAIRATDGIDRILEIKSLFKGHVMAAGKIVPDVLPPLHDALRLEWYHGRSIV